ncbi:ribonuclease S-4 isoform X2 [Capsicum annuum]|uniref:ribonuclease S-4 isoform X2 n=1 Tax=Capsicum annuum TaxID=4072 RepID=UPI001FB11EAA|nr:ribonuclease S-4 isoform X2 [Capsicum annuum]
MLGSLGSWWFGMPVAAGASAQVVRSYFCLQQYKQAFQRHFKFTTQVVTQLTAFWPSLTSRDPKEMWREAWKTYGTCLVTPKLKGPTQYFNRAIRLSDEIGNLLEKHLIQSDGIVPCDSATYTNVEILNSLKTVTTVNNQNEKEVSFTCADINATHAYLNQVTFCYNKDAKDFEDCPTSNRCRVENIIVPRPSPPTTRPSSLQTLQTGEKLQQII